MKAKELAKILLENPEAEVVHYEYSGCATPLYVINNISINKKGEQCESYDGGYGDFIDNSDLLLKKDIIILCS
jgi:hypothetical protein